MIQMRMDVTSRYKVEKPKNIKELPRFLWTVLKNFTTRWCYVFRLVWETRPLVLIVMMFMSVFTGFMPLVGAYIGRAILNSLALAYVGELPSFDPIFWLLILQFSYMFLMDISSRISGMITRVSGELVSNHIKLKIMNKAKAVDMASFDLPEFYAMMENANRESGTRPITILTSTFTVISSVISMVGFILILSQLSIWAPLIMVAVSLPATIVSFIYRKKNVEYMYRKSKERRQMTYYAEAIVNKDIVKEMKLFHLADTFIGKYRSVFQKYFGGLKKLIIHEGAWNVGTSLITTVANCFLFLFIARGVYNGQMQIGDYSLYTGALSSISGGVMLIIVTTASIYEGTLFINNLISFMEDEPQIVPTLTPARPVEKGIAHSIEFKHVSFHYPGTTKHVIDDVSFRVDSGKSTVLVGLNGAGKTTLLKLLIRLYDPTEGIILLDGHDIREYDIEALYDMYGIIFQDFGKYAATAGENISFGDAARPATPDSLTAAAAASNSLEYINKLDDGFNTPLMRFFEPEGVELSIGQWQKLSIARAFYSQSDVLILDEPTASLDPIAEQEIFNQFDTLRKDKTTIFVSHRLSSATTADQIIVVEYGRIVEVGNHQELMKHKDGKYYELFSTQAKRYIVL